MAHLWGLPIIEPTAQVVGACLSLGVKPEGRKGWPEEKDRFHIVMAKTRERGEGKGKIEYRPHDPRFAAFNTADLETRRVFYAMLCYHREEECWHPSYGMYRFPKGDLPNPKTKRFACTGNGTDAERWLDGEATMIKGCGEGCPYRQGDTPPCRPRSRFWFMPRWLPSQGKAFARYMPDASVTMLLERPIMRLATQAREARDTFAGMLQTVRDQAKPLGGISSLYGLPFVMTLSHKTNPDKKTSWHEVTFTLGGDWFEWLKWQAGEFKQLKGAPPLVALGSASDAELDPEKVGAEHAAIVPYRAPGPATKPAVVAEPDVIEGDLGAYDPEQRLRAIREATSRLEERIDGEAQPAVEGPVDPEGDPAQAEVGSPPPAEPIKPIGKEGAEELAAYIKKQRLKAAPRAIPMATSSVIAEAGIPGNLLAEDLIESEAKTVCEWVAARARQMPRAKP